MHDPNTMLARVIAQAKALKIPVSHHIHPQVRLNARAVTRFGCCFRRTDGSYLIELSARMLEAPEVSCLQTLAHEVLHTCPGCRNHGPKWKAYAGQMNQAYGYQIARTGTCQQLGVEDARKIRHLVVCTQCGRQFPRAKLSPLVAHPERYRCKCGGLLRRDY